MKFAEKLFYHTTAYATVISLLVFLIAKISGVPSLIMTFPRYCLILLFSVLLASAEKIFSVESLPKWIRVTIHYTVLCIAFYFIFLNVKTASGAINFSIAQVFAAIIIFSFFYALFFTVRFFIKGKFAAKNNHDKNDKTASKSEYKSMFK